MEESINLFENKKELYQFILKGLYISLFIIIFILGYMIGQKTMGENLKEYYQTKYARCQCPNTSNNYNYDLLYNNNITIDIPTLT